MTGAAKPLIDGYFSRRRRRTDTGGASSTGALTILSFDLKDGTHRSCVIDAARDIGLRVEVANSEQFHVYVNEAMGAYRLGCLVAVRMKRLKLSVPKP